MTYYNYKILLIVIKTLQKQYYIKSITILNLVSFIVLSENQELGSQHSYLY